MAENQIDDQVFASGGLHVESFVRPGKLFTADANLIHSTEGKLSPAAYQRVLNTVVNLLRVGHA